MNTTPTHNQPAGTPGDHSDTFDATGRATAKETAREQFVHGVLGFLHHDKPLRQEQRVQQVMQKLHAAGSSVSITPHASRWILRPMRALTGIAAAAVLAGSAFLLWPSTTTATSMIDSSLSAAEAAGDRRYELSIFGPGGKQPDNAPKGTIDVRSSDRYVVQFQTPRGQLAFGRDDTGDWTIRPDGRVDRLNAQRGRPRWLDSGEASLFLGSVESVLETLKTEYATNRVEAAPLPGKTELCNRLTATRKSLGGPEPLRIELWFDKDSKLVKRMEMHWPEMKFPGPDGHGPEGGPGQGPGGPPNGVRGEGPGGPGGRGPDGPPPARPEAGPDDAPPPPPQDGAGRRDGGPGGDQPPPPRGDMRPQQRRGPGGIGGPGGPGGMGGLGPGGQPFGPGPRGGPDGRRGPGGPGGMQPPPPPRFMDGPPDFRPFGPGGMGPGGPGGQGGPGRPGGPGGPGGMGGMGGQMSPPPPQLVVIQMVDSQPFADNWFSPDAHVQAPAPAVKK